MTGLAKRFVLAQELMAKTRQGKPRTTTKGKNRMIGGEGVRLSGVRQNPLTSISTQ